MHPRDDRSGGERRQFRRLEDSHNATNAARISVVERLVLKHEKWFEDLGVGDMSRNQRAALPVTLEHTVESRRERERWSKRTAWLIGFAGFAGAVIAPVLEHILGVKA